MYPLVDVETQMCFIICFPILKFPKLLSMTGLSHITCRTISDYRYHVPGRTAVQSSLYHRADCTYLSIFASLRGGPDGKIRQSEFFLYSKKDRDAVDKCMEKGYSFPEITGWIGASKKDFELVKELGLKECGILVSCSDYHIFYKMKMTRREAMNHYLSVIRDCLEMARVPDVIWRILQEPYLRICDSLLHGAD